MCLINVLINPCKMATSQEKTQFASWFIETKSDVRTEQKYRTKKSTITPFYLSMAQGIYRDRVSVGYS